MGLIASLSISGARRIGEIGFVIGAIGALLLVLAAARGTPPAANARSLTMLAGLCMAVGFVLGIVYMHWI